MNKNKQVIRAMRPGAVFVMDFILGDKILGHMFLTQHPTIPYEVYDELTARSYRCHSADEAETWLLAFNKMKVFNLNTMPEAIWHLEEGDIVLISSIVFRTSLSSSATDGIFFTVERSPMPNATKCDRPSNEQHLRVDTSDSTGYAVAGRTIMVEAIRTGKYSIDGHKRRNAAMRNTERKFSVGHFPVGTVAKVFVKFSTKEPVLITVACIACNGPNSYVICSDEHDNVTGHTCYNIDHVVGIVKRGDGPLVFDETGNDLNKYAFATRSEWPESEIKKHHSRYLSFWGVALLKVISRNYETEDMCVDYEAMYEYMVKHGYVQFAPEIYRGFDNSPFRRGSILVNKKKLKRATRRLINKFAVNRELAQRRADDSWNESMCNSFDDEDESERGYGGDMLDIPESNENNSASAEELEFDSRPDWEFESECNRD